MRRKSMGPRRNATGMPGAKSPRPDVRPAPSQGTPRSMVGEVKWWHRLKLRMYDLGWSKAELSRRSGVAYDSINKYLRGVVDKPRGDILDQLSNAVGRDSRWLLFGDSQKSSFGASDGQSAKGKFPVFDDFPHIHFLSWEELREFTDVDSGIDKLATARSNFSLNGVAGRGYFGVAVPDNSMAPDFNQRDLIVCATEFKPQNNDYVLVYLKTRKAIYFRRYETLRNSFVLRPLNSDYQVFKDTDYDSVRFVAKIIRHARIEYRVLEPQ